MKKFLVIALCLMLLFSFSACSGTQFLSQAKTNRLVEKYSVDGELPQFEMILTFTSSGNKTVYKVKIVYELLINQSPITAIGFINYLNEGRYDNILCEERVNNSNSQSTHMIMGKYAKKVEGENVTYDLAPVNKTIVGEFSNNLFKGYGEEKHAQFKQYSLAMYHDPATTKGDAKEQQAEYERAYNSANGRLILSLGETALGTAPNYKDYAVFAHPISFSIAKGADGQFTETTTTAPSYLKTNLDNLNTSSITVGTSKPKVLLIDVSFAMISAGDWANIKDNFLVDAD